MECAILVYNANLNIEGKKPSAARKTPTPEGKVPHDPSWRVDFIKLLAALADGRKIRAALPMGSRPPPNDNVWKMFERSSVVVKPHDRDHKNKDR